METYRHKMFKGVLRDVVRRNKRIFINAIIAYAKSIPEPTREDTFLPNIHLLMDIRAEFMAHVNLPGRMELLDSLFKIGISEYAHDTVWQFFIDRVIKAIKAIDWVFPYKWENPYFDTVRG